MNNEIMLHPKQRTIKVEFKQRLKSVMYVKLCAEKTVVKLRNLERSLCEELLLMKAEIEMLSEQLADLKDVISDTAYQISITEINKMAEKLKIENRIMNLNAHKNGFDQMFDRERDLSELRNKEIKDKEAEELELERQRQAQMTEKYEEQAQEAAATEAECDTIERECNVLKKRNHAIMLKLRRRLLETEDTRRELMRENSVTSGSVN